MDDKQRYEIFKVRQGRCHYCGTRLKWEAFETRGLAGGWVITDEEEEQKLDNEGKSITVTHPAQALCYKCFEFPNRGKTAHRLTINEAQRPIVFNQDDAVDPVSDPADLSIPEDVE